jgi:hypothetical protein
VVAQGVLSPVDVSLVRLAPAIVLKFKGLIPVLLEEQKVVAQTFTH